MIINKSKNKKGFTLLESLIAIFILTLAITGPIYISSFSLRSTISSRDNIAAQYLAEEIIEVLKNKRDENLLNSANWLHQITVNSDCFRGVDDIETKCIMTKEDNGVYVFEQCNGDCNPITLSTSTNVIYGNSISNNYSKFTREFYLEKGELDEYDAVSPDQPEKELKITVNIRWQEAGQNRVYSLSERLYDINYIDYFLN